MTNNMEATNMETTKKNTDLLGGIIALTIAMIAASLVFKAFFEYHPMIGWASVIVLPTISIVTFRFIKTKPKKSYWELRRILRDNVYWNIFILNLVAVLILILIAEVIALVTLNSILPEIHSLY